MTQWTFDPTHSSADFTVRHMMVSNVRGSLGPISGTLDFDPENPSEASVDVTIDVTAINTGAEDRDNHLRSADFFEVEKYPNMIFKSTSVESTGSNSAAVTGDLTIRDVTRQVTLNVEFMGQGASPFGDTRAGFEATTTINREDFGLTWNQTLETGGVLVSKEVKVSLDVQTVLVAEPASV
ncbi:MAG: YceI family protein [Anaerolineae bacterium]